MTTAAKRIKTSAEESPLEIAVRPCTGLAEFATCIEIERAVWGSADVDIVPLPLFVVAAETGGQVLGAFAGERMVGFTLAIVGVRNRKPFLHSHMTAVLQQYRNQGAGRGLKLLQREEALANGIDLVEWTFDPLEIKNAYLNIEKLGAIARRYHVNQYGITSSPLQGGLPSDRLVAEWWLKSKRVEHLLRTGAHPGFETMKTISVPAQVYDWKSRPETRNRAQDIQDRNRGEFLTAFADGLAVLGYERDRQGNGKFLLGRWEEKWLYPAA